MAEGTWKDYKETKNSKPLPLRGVRVLEVCTLLLGPSGPVSYTPLTLPTIYPV